MVQAAPRFRAGPMTATPTRRWFRFSLRTVLVTSAVLAGVLGWIAMNAHLVQTRRAMLTSIVDHGGSYGTEIYDPRTEPVDIPWIRKWLGDETVFWIGLRNGSTADEIERVKAIFPEADVGAFEYPIDSIPTYVHP